MTLRQRQPRVKDNKHLEFIRSLPCCICGRIDTEAAHIRTANIQIGKRETGRGEKPSDQWTVPLCCAHHAEQHGMNEMAFWKKHGGIDPFLLAMQLRPTK